MTPTKIALGMSAVISLLFVVVIARTEMPLPQPVLADMGPKSTATIAISSPPFNTPDWVPDEVIKKQALSRAYGFVDVRDEEKVTDPLDKNEIDSFADRVLVPPPTMQKKLKLMHRSEVKVEKKQRDVCEMHKMHKAPTHGGKSWRCER